MMFLLPFWAFNVIAALLSMQGQKALGFHKKIYSITSTSLASLLCLLMKMHWSWTGGSRKRSPPRHFMFNICSDTSAKASLLEQLVINKPRHPWNYDILNTSPSSLILHLSIYPSIHASTYPLIPCLPTILCRHLCWWWNETFRSTCITRILWVRLLILSWNLEEKKSEKLSEISYMWGFIKLTSSDEVIRVW